MDMQVDVDSNGRRCKERMLDVLSRVESTTSLYSDFQVKRGRSLKFKVPYV